MHILTVRILDHSCALEQVEFMQRLLVVKQREGRLDFRLALVGMDEATVSSQLTRPVVFQASLGCVRVMRISKRRRLI